MAHHYTLPSLDDLYSARRIMPNIFPHEFLLKVSIGTVQTFGCRKIAQQELHKTYHAPGTGYHADGIKYCVGRWRRLVLAYRRRLCVDTHLQQLDSIHGNHHAAKENLQAYYWNHSCGCCVDASTPHRVPEAPLGKLTPRFNVGMCVGYCICYWSPKDRDTNRYPTHFTRSVPRLGLRFGSLRTTSEIHGYSINRKISTR